MWRPLKSKNSGQAVIEYLMLLFITTIFVVGFYKAMTETIDKGVLKFGGKFERQLKSSRMKTEVWKN